MFHYTVETQASVQDAVAAVEKALGEEKFGVLWQFDIREKLQGKGFDFERKFVVLEVCNPGEAHKVLNTNHMAGYFLPCKIVVYEEDGVTKIGMPKPTLFMEHLQDPALKEVAADVEQRLASSIRKAAVS